MTKSDKLRRNKNQHVVKNNVSIKQEEELESAIIEVIGNLVSKNETLTFCHESHIKLETIRNSMTGIDSSKLEISHENASIRPDGGVVYLQTKTRKLPLLIVEAKKQGTNNLRLLEGQKKQAQGNAIERLGKNLAAVRTWFANEEITPFVCFGYGCDFAKGSSILCRVEAMNAFYKLNTVWIKSEGRHQPVSMFFRETRWTVDEMVLILSDVASKSLDYYASLGLIND